MRKIWIVIFVGLSFLSFDLPKSAIKKIDKVITSLWPEQVVEKKAINLSNKQLENFKDNKLYQLINNKKSIGYLYLTKARSKITYFDYMIIFNTDLSIKKIKVLIYREEQGGEIGSKRWLKQFEGKSSANEMKFGDDIQNISGATISARSMTNGVGKATKQVQNLKLQGVFN